MAAIDSTVVYIFAAAGILALGYLFYPSIKRFRDGRPKPKKVDKKKEKALKELKEIRDAAKPPDDVKIPELNPVAPSTAMEQFPTPKTIQIELTRIKEGTNKRATTRKGKVNLVPRFGGGKDMFFFYVGKYGYFIDPSKIIRVTTIVKGKTVIAEKLVYDVFNMEPLNEDGTLTFSWPLELLHRDSVLDQYITVATFEGGFQMTAGLAKAIIVVGLLGTLIGLSVNGTVGLTPHTIIHWVP